jgi:hypothetical protein
MPDIHLDLVALILAAIFGVMSHATLKAKLNSLEEDRKILWKKVEGIIEKHDALDEKIVSQLTSIRESLARMEGRMNPNS